MDNSIIAVLLHIITVTIKHSFLTLFPRPQTTCGHPSCSAFTPNPQLVSKSSTQ